MNLHILLWWTHIITASLLFRGGGVIVKVWREVACASFVGLGRPVTETEKSVLVPPSHVKVLAADLFQTLLEVHDRPGVNSDNATSSAAILVSGTAFTRPHSALQEFLGVLVVVID